MEGGLPAAYPRCLLFAGQEVFPGTESPAGKGSIVAQLLDRQMQYREKREILLFASFSLSLGAASVFPLQEVPEITHPNEHHTCVVS